MSGFTGEAAEVLKFDLSVQGFSLSRRTPRNISSAAATPAASPAAVTDKFAKRVHFVAQLQRRERCGGRRTRSRTTSCSTITGKKAIGQTKIAFKSQPAARRGRNLRRGFRRRTTRRRVTHDGAIVAKPAWVPGRLALYYTSYARGNPDIFYHSLSTGQRRVIAGYSGLNTSAAVSPDGSKVAMILSKSRQPERLGLQRRRHEFETAHDGQRGFLAVLVAGRRMDLFRDEITVAPAAGESFRRAAATVQIINTTGAANPTEPDWSPDGKWIAFTSQTGDFDICVMPADGSARRWCWCAGRIRRGRRTRGRWFSTARSATGKCCLCLTFSPNNTRIVRRATGSNSQPAWAR